ncbi:PTI1-like tyrosine-protein kinase [Acorus calamus]|uniref:PTI1-like tyrosine-protein kinase n=1 Tax=Acorus calamus TaxID=4465 RepID=A0AAV9FDJ2_ACOCL|nr:PTI1-like tyrosine-protein kinase [Acorus calamus]
MSHRLKKKQCYPWENFTLRGLQHATNNFHNDNKLGEGCFGSVYWGRTSQGTEPIEKLPGGVKHDIVQWATPHVKGGRLRDIVDPRLRAGGGSILYN